MILQGLLGHAWSLVHRCRWRFVIVCGLSNLRRTRYHRQAIAHAHVPAAGSSAVGVASFVLALQALICRMALIGQGLNRCRGGWCVGHVCVVIFACQADNPENCAASRPHTDANNMHTIYPGARRRTPPPTTPTLQNTSVCCGERYAVCCVDGSCRL